MNKKVIPIIVQLKQNNNYIVEGIEQNDMGIIFDMKVMDGLHSFNYIGYAVVSLKIKRPDGTFYIDSNSGNAVDVIDPENGRLKINIPASCTAQNGMHFCTIGFGYDEDTYFETATFNYFVGDDPHPEDEDITGTDEFPVLNNLIAQVSGMLSSEETRTLSELSRQEAEASRESVTSALISLFVETLGLLEDLLADSHLMLDEIIKALAEGGSVDISRLTALATKDYVASQLSDMTFDFSERETPLVIRHEALGDMVDLAEGELLYDTNSKTLYVGEGGGTAKSLNDPCFSAGTTEPSDTTKLWIDTSGTVPSIRYFNGTEWVSCNTAVYA